MSRLLDPRRKDGTFPFEYRNSAATDVRETFDRVRREQQTPKVAQVRTLNPQKRKQP